MKELIEKLTVLRKDKEMGEVLKYCLACDIDGIPDSYPAILQILPNGNIPKIRFVDLQEHFEYLQEMVHHGFTPRASIVDGMFSWIRNTQNKPLLESTINKCFIATFHDLDADSEHIIRDTLKYCCTNLDDFCSLLEASVKCCTGNYVRFISIMFPDYDYMRNRDVGKAVFAIFSMFLHLVVYSYTRDKIEDLVPEYRTALTEAFNL